MQPLKIRLIEPKPASFHVYDLTNLPRLGLPLIGTILREQGHDVKVYCEIVAPADEKELFSADLVGISSLTSTVPAAYEWADRLREAGVPTIMGGPHVTFMSDEALDHTDWVAVGEGHDTMTEFIEVFQGGRDPATVTGLAWRDQSGAVRHNPPRKAANHDEFNALPWPDLSLIEGHDKIGVMPVMTTWGCPYDCDFCSVIQMFGRKVRERDPVEVVDLIEAHSPNRVFFYDDIFFSPKDRGKAILREMIRRDVRPSWICQMRADAVYTSKKNRTIDYELLELMRESNAFVACIGFESINPSTLESYNKKIDLGHITDAISALHKYKIGIHGMFVVGADQDSPETIRETVAFAKEHKIETIQLMVITPLPGTPYYNRLKSEGRIICDDWSLYDGHFAVVAPEGMTPYQLQKETIKAMSSFYSRDDLKSMIRRRVGKNLPYLASLPFREPRLWSGGVKALVHLARLRGNDALLAVERAVSRDTWYNIERRLGVLGLRAYGRQQVERWQLQARASEHLARLEAFVAERGLTARPAGATG